MCICQILSLATWEVFFSWHVETLLSVALASVHTTDCAGSEKEVLLVLPALYCMYCLWISVIRFLISVIRFLALFIDFPPVIIRDAEYLVLWPFVDCFLFSSLNCVKKMSLLQLAS